MIGNAKAEEVKFYEAHPDHVANSFRAPSQLGVPAARKVWEDKIVRELAVDEESPEIQVMRAKIREELKADMSREKSSDPVPVPASLEEFAELKEGTAAPEAPAKKPMRTKKIKVA